MVILGWPHVPREERPASALFDVSEVRMSPDSWEDGCQVAGREHEPEGAVAATPGRVS